MQSYLLFFLVLIPTHSHILRSGRDLCNRVLCVSDLMPRCVYVVVQTTTTQYSKIGILPISSSRAIKMYTHNYLKA